MKSSRSQRQQLSEADEDHFRHLFDNLVRIASGCSGDNGTGFGLSIVKMTTEEHGWKISVTDSQEGGARFEISGVEFVAE